MRDKKTQRSRGGIPVISALILLSLKVLTCCPCINLMHSGYCSLSPAMHLHEKRPTKHAGETGGGTGLTPNNFGLN